MKKYIFVIVSLLTLVAISFVWAAPKGDPFTAVWEAINNLQELVNNIQLIPGPQGEQGPIGPTGPQGPQGITGAGDIKFIYYVSPEQYILKNDGKEYQWSSFESEWIWQPAYDVPIPTDDIVQWQRSMFLDKDGNVWSILNGWHIAYPTPPPVIGPTVDIKANGSDGPITITYNTSVNLTWESTNSSSCQASNGWSGSKTTSGSELISNLVSSKTYTITCTGPTGSASDNVTVNTFQPGSFSLVSDSVTPRNQAILAPVSQAVVAFIKVTAGGENQNLRSLTLTCNTTAGNCANYYSNVAVYDGATQVTNYVVPNATSVVFAAGDIINVETFSVGVPKTLKIVANTLGIAAGTSSWAVAAGDMVTVGINSGQIATNAALVDLRVNSGGLGANTGGVFTAYPDVLEMKVNAVSPAGTISRGTFAPVAKWDLISRGADAAGVDVTDITFTSKTGLSGMATSDAALVRLYDETNGVVLSTAASTTINVANGTIRFQMAAGTLRVAPTAVRVISLQITTTNTTKFPAYSSMWFTVNTAANATVLAATGGGARGTGYGGTVWSIPADAYQVSLTI